MERNKSTTPFLTNTALVFPLKDEGDEEFSGAFRKLTRMGVKVQSTGRTGNVHSVKHIIATRLVYFV